MSDETALVIMKGDAVVGKISSEILPMLNPLLQRNGGDSTLGTLADAVQMGVNVVEAIGIRDDIDDGRDALDRLYTARKSYYEYLATGAFDGKTMALKQQAIDKAQDEVDRSQNRALSKGITVLWTNAFGGLGRVLERVQGGGRGIAGMLGFGGGGDNGLTSGLLGGGLGFLFGSMWSRRRREDRDEESNVPPVV